MNENNLQDLILKNTFVISIDKKRLDLFTKVFEYHGIPFPTLIEGIVGGPKGLCKTDANILEMAMGQNLDYCFIFEDDAYPCTDIMKKLQETTFPKADIYIVGWSSTNVACAGGKAWASMTTGRYVYGTHAFVVMKSAYTKLLELFRTAPVADAVFESAVKNGLSVLVLNNPLFIQYNETKSGLNKHCGYVLRGDRKIPPRGFPKIEEIVNDK